MEEIRDIKIIDKNKEQNSKRLRIANYLKDKTNNVMGFLESIVFKEPLVYSLSYENNIACKLPNANMLVTKDGNLCAGLKLEGISYAGASMEGELDLADNRARFFNRLDSSIELNIFIKKELIDLNLGEHKTNNIYANEVIEKWERGRIAYKISYYLIFSTKTKRITGFFETWKRKTTEEQSEENTSLSYESKVSKLKEVLTNAISDLSPFSPKQLSSDDILNFYATYSNMQETKLKYSNTLISDCYITSDIEFKKDYMIFYRNDCIESINTNSKNKENDKNKDNNKEKENKDYAKKVYARFISVKAYETEGLSTLISTEILREDMDYYVILNAQAIPKQEAKKKVKRIKVFSVDLVKNQLEELLQLIESDRENIIKISYSILVISHKDIEDLNERTNILKSLLERHSLSVIKETLNQRPLFFSFFPSRGNLNARLRHQTSAALSTLVTFENDILGNKNNRWGDNPITIFPHISGSPFFFNFHDNNSSSAVGHTLVIGGTGYGKTTIMQFLMLNLFKYDINIFAMDKMRGMHNFAEYVDGEYHDLENNQFKLNPFSLDDTNENNIFLMEWLGFMAGIKEEQHEILKIMHDTLKQIRATQEHFTGEYSLRSLKDYHDSLTLPDEKDGDLKIKFKQYLEGIFDNKEDALNFKKQLTILNMDAILKNQKICSLCAYYIFHKIKNISKNNNKGFFIWIDELRDYLLDESMRSRIIEMIVEIRKINGVITMGIQNLDFLEDTKNTNTLIENMTNFIIFPTKDENTLKQMKEKISLTDSEVNFLKSANKDSRQILFKQKNVGSAILDVNLSVLGKHIKIFSSSSNDVLDLKELKNKTNNWRELYLNDISPKTLQKEIQ